MHERHQERRLVTCLFIDVVGSTELTMRLGPERLKNALDAAFSELRALIVAHGGTVEKYIGDAIYALFGAPVSHADDPCRALRVAFACLRWAAERDPADVPFLVRVGVETGEAIVDLSAAETTMQQMSVGAVVNIAARLQQRAEPGQALVGPTCHAAAFDAAELIPLGEIELKGIGTLPAWSLVGIADVAPSVSLPFVGRAAELGLLGYALQRALSGRSVLALVSGPPGQGKTRLVSEFVSHLTPETRLITARCRPEGEIGALTPLRQLLGDHLEELLGELFDDRAERDRVAAVLTHSAGLLTSEALSAMVPTERADEIANGWRRYLAALARGGSLVAWIEDVHWADPAVVRLIDRVTKGSDRLLVVATARPEFSEAAGLRPSGDRFFIELAGLEAAAASSLAQSAGSTDDLALARADTAPAPTTRCHSRCTARSVRGSTSWRLPIGHSWLMPRSRARRSRSRTPRPWSSSIRRWSGGSWRGSPTSNMSTRYAVATASITRWCAMSRTGGC
jgi:class 3 adenylate cyclase